MAHETVIVSKRKRRKMYTFIFQDINNQGFSVNATQETLLRNLGDIRSVFLLILLYRVSIPTI